LVYDREQLSPYYYSTHLDSSSIQIEFTPTPRCGYFRFTFPDGNPILLLANQQEGELTSTGISAFTGVERFNNMQAFVYGEFSVPVNFTKTQEGTKSHLVIVAAEPSAALNPSEEKKKPFSSLAPHADKEVVPAAPQSADVRQVPQPALGSAAARSKAPVRS